MNEIYGSLEFLDGLKAANLKLVVENLVKTDAKADSRMELLKEAEPFPEAAKAAFEFADEKLLNSLIIYLSRHRGNTTDRTAYAKALAARKDNHNLNNFFQLQGPNLISDNKNSNGYKKVDGLTENKAFELLLNSISSTQEETNRRSQMLAKYPFLEDIEVPATEGAE